MSSLGPSGSSHGMYPQSIKRGAGFPASFPTQQNKQSPAPHSTSPYPPQAYQTQQPPHGAYPQHLFSTSAVNGSVSNGAARGSASHMPNALGLTRQRSNATPRQQIQGQGNTPSMIYGSMNQPVQHELLSHQQQQHATQQHHQQTQQQQTLPRQSHHAAHPNQQHPQSHQLQQSHQLHQNHQGHKLQQTQPTHQLHQTHQQQPQAHPHPQHGQQQPQHQPPQHHPQQQQQQPPPQQQQQQQQPQGQQHQQMPHQQAHQVPQSHQGHQHHQTPPLQHQQRNTPQQQHRQVSQSQSIPPTQAQVQQMQQQVQQATPPQPHRTTPQQQQKLQPPQPRKEQQPPQTDTTQQQVDQQVADEMEMDSHNNDAEETNSLQEKMMSNPDFVPTQPMGEMMSPPPEGGSYPTLEAVQKAVLRYCTSVGYAIVIGRSKKTVPGLKKVLFVCDRAGKPPSRVSPEFRKRKTSSRKCDCPFGFFAIEQRTQWTIRYRPDPTHLKHNHGPSESPSNHPAARKLDSKMVAAVKQLKENGAGVSETLQILQTENPDCHLLPRDIYNARAAINRNPAKVAQGLTENRPAIYTKPSQSPEDRIRADLRRELAKAKEDLERIEDDKQKEIDELKAKLEEKDKIIHKFEMFIDICNQRVMVQRERLDSAGGDNNAS